jgi:hypothetical protein
VLSEMGAVKNPDLKKSAVIFVRRYYFAAITGLYKNANIGQSVSYLVPERHLLDCISKICVVVSIIVRRQLDDLFALPAVLVASDYVKAAFFPLIGSRSQFGEHLPDYLWFRLDVDCQPVVMDHGCSVCLRLASRQHKIF